MRCTGESSAPTKAMMPGTYEISGHTLNRLPERRRMRTVPARYRMVARPIGSTTNGSHDQRIACAEGDSCAHNELQKRSATNTTQARIVRDLLMRKDLGSIEAQTQQ